jgi:hypothetical protein
MNDLLNSPVVLMLIIVFVKVFLAFKVRDWARRRGRTGKAWLVCAILALIPTIVVLVLLPKMPVITMQRSSQHKIELFTSE